MSEEELVRGFVAAWRCEGFLSREHEEARLEAGRAALRRFREEQLGARCRHPGLRRAGVQLPARRGPGARPLRPGGHHPARRGGARAAPVAAATSRSRAARTSWSPRSFCLPGAGRHHGLQVVRRARSRQGPPAGQGLPPALDLRDGLRGDDRAAAGRRRAPLPRDRAWSGTAPRGPQADRQGARLDPRRPRPGSGRASSRPKPNHIACTYCAFREICPASVAR